VAYDVTRLIVRCAAPSPNGIDRIDLAYARHLIERLKGAGVFLHGLQPAVLDRTRLVSLLSEIEASWCDGPSDIVAGYERVRNFLHGAPEKPRDHTPRHTSPVPRLAPLRFLNLQVLAQELLGRIPTGAVFVHSTHYPQRYLFRWLGRRPDIRAVFFVHDLLPLQFPEYFAPAHVAEHRRAMEIFARYGHAAIVNTHVVADQMSKFLTARGRNDLRILVRPIPPDPVFATMREPDPALAAIPYFVVCATIEPRKNHLLLLHVWREIARRLGNATPKLVVVGRRGWENENVVDLLERSHELRPHVVEIGGLPTRAVARLIAGARALLAPSFGEGYGLPLVEARAIGAPIIASDIPVFRETAPDATFCRPLDGIGWLDAIIGHAEQPMRTVSAPPSGVSTDPMANYFAAVDAFLASV
jgi:glycosyltransferase involved in cell wall biosynthesis